MRLCFVCTTAKVSVVSNETSRLIMIIDGLYNAVVNPVLFVLTYLVFEEETNILLMYIYIFNLTANALYFSSLFQTTATPTSP